MLSGVLFSLIAGAAMSIQGVVNTRLSEKIGLLESNMFVQGTAFALSLVAMWVFGKGNLQKLMQINKFYLSGGVIGLIITVTVMLAIKDRSPTLAISVILISQLFVAAMIDAFGLMGTDQVAFTWQKFVAMGMMVGGVILFKRF